MDSPYITGRLALAEASELMSSYGDDADKAYLAKQVINYYIEDEVPVMTTLVQNYLTFNHWHSDHPGVSPNKFPCSITAAYEHVF